MSSYSRYFPPALKSTVDLQLQSAFGEGNWAAAARLAGKRAKSLQDPYYEAIRLCAESQLDGLGEKCAVLVKVADLVRQGTVVKDLDVLDLYEWACRDFLDDLDYSATLGLLRLRWAKQNPRSPGVMPCLQACLQHWDLVNAQQIAVLLDKSAPPTSTDRRFMYWSIVLTYLLSISPQCPDGKKDLYGLLALKQLERAADLTEASDKDDRTDRGLRTEEEIYLFYRVLARLGTRSDFVKRLRSPRIGPLAQFEKGRKHLLWMALDALDAGREWDDVYDLCLAALGRKEDGNDEAPSFLAADWRVWKSFITAASRRSDPQAAFAEVQKLLDAFIATKAPVAQMYKKNIALAVLEATFRLPESLLPDTFLSASPMPRVAQIGLFLDQNFDRPSAFDDVKGYVSSLSVEEVQYFLGEMLPKLSEGQWTVKSSLIAVLDLKFRYFLTTCPQTLSPAPAPAVPPPDGADRRSSFLCLVNARWTPEPYSACLLGLVQSAAAATRKLSADAELMKSLPALDKDPRIDLSLVWGLSLLKLAGLTGRHASSSSPSGSPLENVDPSLFLQAVLLLDTQLKKTPGDTSLRLLLVRLYLLLGCASYAYRLWVPMDVKRTIQDALSPLFFDRLSSLAPGLFQGGRPPTEPLRAYYQTTLQDRAPVRIWDAFAAGSYTSILDMADYDDRLRRSCTLVMSVVEERRAARAFGGRLDGNMEDLPLMGGYILSS
ncbi:hypothetical protein VTK73DRAFT_9055 [Phialemonium thermophilum]|uniref:Uncharacterized protein n=1 Tax=Phialemonium thermophilum TaxID=223376 RepID=A0ABR3W510_9PEZI